MTLRSRSIARFVPLCARVSLRAGYSPTGQRSLHTSVGAGPGGSGGSAIVLDDERDTTGQHQSATAAAVAAAAAVRKSCLAGSHASAPWRPQGKLPSRSTAAAAAAAAAADAAVFSRRIRAVICNERSILLTYCRQKLLTRIIGGV